jgi:hypothetical protein
LMYSWDTAGLADNTTRWITVSTPVASTTIKVFYQAHAPTPTPSASPGTAAMRPAISLLPLVCARTSFRRRTIQRRSDPR